jgi:hypothetical protein
MMRPNSTATLCFALALALSATFAAPTRATTLMRMNLAQLVRASQEIVRARCVANATAWDAAEIWTFTTFDVEETWRGSSRGRITVRLLGGRTATITSTVSGVPRFHVGEEVVLFLERSTGGDFSVVSWEQGTFRVQHDSRTGAESVTQDTASFETFDPPSRRFVIDGIRAMSISELRARVDAATAEGAKP